MSLLAFHVFHSEMPNNMNDNFKSCALHTTSLTGKGTETWLEEGAKGAKGQGGERGRGGARGEGQREKGGETGGERGKAGGQRGSGGGGWKGERGGPNEWLWGGPNEASPVPLYPCCYLLVLNAGNFRE